MPKDRGIEKVEVYFGDFLKLVEQKVKKKRGRVRILDAGCGYGVAIMGFVKRFGNKVELVGFNSIRRNGNTRIMKQQAIEKRIFTKEELKKVKNLPKSVYCDASKKLLFRDNSFDFIYSMASIYLYDDKIHFLEECSRILKKNGIARISPSFGVHNDQSYGKVKNIPEEYWEFWRIWNKGKEVKMWEYCKRIKGVKAVWRNRGKKRGSKMCYIEIKKQKKLDFKLRFIAAIDLNFIWEQWGGVKSIYTTQLNFKPRYKELK